MNDLNIILSDEANSDIEKIEAYIASIYRPEAGQKFITRLFSYISDLSFAATSFTPSRYKAARLIHPQARSMPVMHRWTVVFHIEEQYVIVDKILPSSMVKY